MILKTAGAITPAHVSTQVAQRLDLPPTDHETRLQQLSQYFEIIAKLRAGCGCQRVWLKATLRHYLA